MEEKRIWKKNDELILTIEDLGSEGEGIGHVDGYALFVKNAVPGDKIKAKIIKAKKNYGYAIIQELMEPSPWRAEPVCPIAGKCGGCQMQHISYEKQLEFKRNKVYNCLKRIGGLEDIEVEPVIGMENPYHYRNKAQYPVGLDKEGGLITGFYAGRTHTIMPADTCYIQHPVNEEILRIIKDFMREYRIKPYDEKTGKGLVRHIITRVGYSTGEIMVCLVINGSSLPHSEKLTERLAQIKGMKSICLNINQENTNVILGEKIIPLFGEPYICDYIGEIKYRISPLSFYQVNPEQTRKLYEKALEFAGLTGKETVWDLYCGIGTISLFLAKQAKKVCGVEIVPRAIEDAKWNAKENGIDNAEFFAGAAEDVLPAVYKESGGSLRADVIVVDPPRKGCEESLLDTIADMEPERIVYVSCDPATLARDLKYLGSRGYRVNKVQPVDMFGHSRHVETVVLLERKTL
ncbi:23S rRNA (uracil(1939)-C(5))-methyltransferase RlmD [Anaerolentibacter hominis]|uniref:23S rRNA (uracil(1939)-C(5))-methyltransferase RlmD n=1 Tax=Anaerolentibacter hominis TaxID=3079009 RepID=UPI0031B83D63